MASSPRSSITRAERELYYYAIRCALSTLVGYAASFGRGWYHLADGEVISATEIKL